MLKFYRLRWLRRKLLFKGNLKKYLVYALGEILLVVLGILIALQINNWSESVKDEIAEKNYLRSIKEDLVSDTISLNEVLEQIELNLDAASTLIKFFNQSQKEPVDTNKIYASIRLAGFLMHFETNAATFDDLKNTGNIKVISNVELKKAIASYYTFIETRRNYRNLWQDKVWGDYWEARDDLINVKLDAFWSNSYHTDQVAVELPRDFDISREEAKHFIQSLYNIIDITTFREKVFNDINKRAKELIVKVSAEIEDG